MSPFTRRRERIVETHRDVTDEEAAGVGDFQAGRSAFHEAVSFKRGERRKFAAEVLLEVDA